MDARVAVAAGIAGLAVIGCGASTSPMSASQPPATASVGAGPVARALQQTWRSYAHSFIRDGRVVDPRNDYNTTSEGQSYALLRAVWMDDRFTFDAVWTWTRDHLWVDAEQRFGWSWVASAAQLVSQDSATDADQDIALALVFAAHRWSGGYMDWARRVLTGIWRNEVTTVGGTPYVTAGN